MKRKFVSKLSIILFSGVLLTGFSEKVKSDELFNYFSGVKYNILKNQTYDSLYDINQDGVVNAMDAIRIKKNECSDDKRNLQELKNEINSSNYSTTQKDYKVVINCSMSTGYINSITGVGVESMSTYCMSDYIEIPSEINNIINDCVYNYSGVAGWAFYDSSKSFISGGQSQTMDVPENAKYVRISSFGGVLHYTIRHIWYLSDTKEFTEYPLHGKLLAFAGDSITFGYDDDNNGYPIENTWTKQVGDKLKTISGNYGVNSASLMPVSGTPHSIYNAYMSYSDNIDIIGFMIGVNDSYRGYPFGTVNDNTTDTYLGCLNLLCQGAVSKWKPSDGKKVFLMTYAHNDQPQNQRSDVRIGNLTGWEAWNEGIRQVAKKYSIPVCDVYNELGICCELDAEGEYWRYTSSHSPHLTQKGADVFANYIANYISRTFSID